MESKSRFDEFFDWLMGWEGRYYENDPDDPGGETKYGIDKRSHPHLNIRKLTEAEAKDIYWREYWTPMAAEQFPWRLAWVLADIAVNNGRTRAIIWGQELAGAEVDGRLGPKTIAAWKKDHARLGKALLDRRERFYNAIATGRRKKFLKGWLNRNNDLERAVA